MVLSMLMLLAPTFLALTFLVQMVVTFSASTSLEQLALNKMVGKLLVKISGSAKVVIFLATILVE
jgi:hypothetical protein